MRRAVLTWIIGFGLYLLFVGRGAPAEFCVAAISASLGAGLVVFLQRHGRAAMRVEAPWFLLAARLARSIATDLWRVGRALTAAIGGSAVRGTMVKQPFEIGPEVAQANARRALDILLGSLAPNGFVTDIDPDGRALVIHRLAPAPLSEDPRWPV